jgi:transcriptional regulator of acetoin/glycerol metabolism
VKATAADPFPDGRSDALRESRGEQTVQLPPLRDRRPEFVTLAAAMLNDIAPTVHVSGRALAALQNYGGPTTSPNCGRCAQSANAAGRHMIGLEHLPGEVAGTLCGSQALSRIEELEREAIIAALREQQHGNELRAAEALGMSRSTFYRRLRQLRLDPSALLS